MHEIGLYIMLEPIFGLFVIFCVVVPIIICICRRQRRYEGRVLSPGKIRETSMLTFHIIIGILIKIVKYGVMVSLIH